MRNRTVMMPTLALAVAIEGAIRCDDGYSQGKPTTIAGPHTHRFDETEWVITGVIAADVAHSAPSDELKLGFRGARVGVELGCNAAYGCYFADRNDDGESGFISISDLISTELPCADTEDWSLLAEALSEATTWSVSTDINQDKTLRLEGPRLTAIATTAASPPVDLTVDESPVEPETSRMVIDLTGSGTRMSDDGRPELSGTNGYLNEMAGR